MFLSNRFQKRKCWWTSLVAPQDLRWESSGLDVFNELARRHNVSPFLFWATLMDDTQLQRPPLGRRPWQPVC